MKSEDTLHKTEKKASGFNTQSVTFQEILKYHGRKDDPFYVLDSAEIDIPLSLKRPVKANDVSILYVYKGEITVKHDTTTSVIAEGALLIKPPDITFQIQSISKNCHFKIFGFTQQYIVASELPVNHLEAFALTALRDPVIILDIASTESIVALLELLERKGRLREKPPLYEESIRHAFSLLILEIVSLARTTKTDGPLAITHKEHWTFQFLQLLHRHIKEQRRVNFYAEMLCITPKYLSTCVKEVTGRTCGEIITEMVVMEAKVLLGDPALTIGQIADELNFSDQFLFSKYFKKNTGLSPLRYRKTV